MAPMRLSKRTHPNLRVNLATPNSSEITPLDALRNRRPKIQVLTSTVRRRIMTLSVLRLRTMRRRPKQTVGDSTHLERTINERLNQIVVGKDIVLNIHQNERIIPHAL
jgi:hypothetical protein